jgi:3-hydroxyisobutyrate dehydrogenase
VNTMLRVAVLGLGAMGLPMASRLAGARAGRISEGAALESAAAEDHTVEGAASGTGTAFEVAAFEVAAFEVAAFDVAGERRALAEAAGATASGSAAQAARGAAVTVVAVRDGEQAEAALFGPEGAAESLEAGAVVVLTSTIGPDAARDLAARLASRQIRLLDAPVSGGPVRAGKGDLLVVAGADAGTVAAARPVLDALGSAVHVVGAAPGDGQTMKIVNQLLCGIHTAAAAEALGLANRLGLDVPAVLEILGQGAAASFMLADRGSRIAELVTGGEPELRSRMDVIAKDMRLVTQVAATAGMPTPLAATADHLYRQALAHGMAPNDDSYLVRLLDPKT